MFETDEFIPSLTWEQMRALLDSLADTPEKRAMVSHLVEATRKQAPFLTPNGVMKELIFIGAVMLDARFRPPALDTTPSPASSRSSSSRQPSRW